MAVDEATFHSNESAAYVLPNDASEQERLEKQSHAVVAMMKGGHTLIHSHVLKRD